MVRPSPSSFPSIRSTVYPTERLPPLSPPCFSLSSSDGDRATGGSEGSGKGRGEEEETDFGEVILCSSSWFKRKEESVSICEWRKKVEKETPIFPGKKSFFSSFLQSSVSLWTREGKKSEGFFKKRFDPHYSVHISSFCAVSFRKGTAGLRMSAKNGLFDPEYVAKERENILLVFDANESFLFLAKRKRRRRRPTKMSFFYSCAH